MKKKIIVVEKTKMLIKKTSYSFFRFRAFFLLKLKTFQTTFYKASNKYFKTTTLNPKLLTKLLRFFLCQTKQLKVFT